MEVRIVILPDGTLGLFTESGSYEEGKVQIARLIKQLRAEGIEFSEVGETEQHRHDEAHVHAHVHGEAHSH